MVDPAGPEVAPTARPGYRFEPLARGGVMLGLSGGQLALVGACVLAALIALRAAPGAGGFAAAGGAVLCAVAACRPVAGRSLLQWAGVASRFVGRRKRQVGAPPGHVPGRHSLRLPDETFAQGVYLAEAVGSGAEGRLGVVLDERTGTAAALLRARGGAFCLLDGPGKEQRLAAWAGVLESLANQRSQLVRLQWCQRALPGDAAGLLAHLKRTGDPAVPGFAGQCMLLESAGDRAWRHETVLVLAVRAPVARRHGRVPSEVALVLRNEVFSLRAQLHGAGIACDGPLDAEGTAGALGSLLVPGLDRHRRMYPWPLAVEEGWAEVRAGGWWHRTYWVAEWPRSRVGPDFLAPLLVGRGRRSFSVVMAPVAPERAARDAESSRTAQLADARLRAQGGFLETARHRRQAEALEGREVELADGRGAYQFAGYVTVSASGKEELDRCGADLERAAGAARLCLRPLYGQQKDALIWALPFGRGL